MINENEGQSTLVEIETPQIGVSSDEKDTTANEAAENSTSDGSADQAEEIEGDEGEDGEGKPKKRSRWERERRARERLIAENAALKERQRALEQAQTAQTRQVEDTGPRQEDFNDYFDYLEARAVWRAEQHLAPKIEEARRSAQTIREQEQRAQVVKSFNDRVAKFAATVEDYADALETSPDLPAHVLSVVEDAVYESEVGPQMVYALAKDEALMLRLARMSPTKAAIELGKLEARLTQTKPKVQTNAPAPITRLKGGGASAPKDISKMSMEEYRAYRNAGKS